MEQPEQALHNSLQEESPFLLEVVFQLFHLFRQQTPRASAQGGRLASPGRGPGAAKQVKDGPLVEAAVGAVHVRCRLAAGNLQDQFGTPHAL